MTSTFHRIARRSARASAAAVALLSSASIACRTPGVASAAGPVTAAPSPEAKESRPLAPAAETAESRTAAAAADGRPVVLVMPSGNAYLVLRVGLEQHEDALTWDVLYLAEYDAAELARQDAQDRLALVAHEFLAAFGPIADVGQVERLSITAILGKPGGSASIERLWFTRDAAGWRADAAAGERAIAEVPPVRTQVIRDPDEEVSARDAAAEFISDADRGDYDAAWARTSALVKAMMSQGEFVRHLEQWPEADGASDGDLYVSFAAPVERFLPGANMVAWIARETASGPAVEALLLRLDDDMEWRVSGVLQWTAAHAAMTRQGRTPPLEADRAR